MLGSSPVFLSGEVAESQFQVSPGSCRFPSGTSVMIGNDTF